ncbi:MAG: CopD family protein [Actinomycetota bacterium]|nr:hypothetical protein [Acidimicrobiales bacterium]MEC8815337.1 CopD family protein [Actinomycetota bacterium]MEC8970937.1 CopD family protein [Actinomycetota bacterium]MEC8983305.1 CopD family protein [Actinomycetota bacterium]MEC9057546.1 CopD family protein [Actinomycetota bacterium]|tara:strand:- start:212 stop:610 length:399 start_codon:yes stop_codon:yes gene_type:complete
MAGLDDIRIFLHLLGVCGWVGGQIVMVSLLPVLRDLGPDAPRTAARRFARIAWPCFALTVATGIWSLTEIGLEDRDTTYLASLLVKLLLVGASGASIAVHSTTRSPALRGVTGALGTAAALGALLMGAALPG